MVVVLACWGALLLKAIAGGGSAREIASERNEFTLLLKATVGPRPEGSGERDGKLDAARLDSRRSSSTSGQLSLCGLAVVVKLQGDHPVQSEAGPVDGPRWVSHA